MLAIDLSPSSAGGTILPGTFDEIDPRTAVQYMADTADPAKLYPGMSLRAFAEAGNPHHLSE